MLGLLHLLNRYCELTLGFEMVAFTLQNPGLAIADLVTINFPDLVQRKCIFLGLNIIYFW